MLVGPSLTHTWSPVSIHLHLPLGGSRFRSLAALSPSHMSFTSYVPLTEVVTTWVGWPNSLGMS